MQESGKTPTTQPPAEPRTSQEAPPYDVPLTSISVENVGPPTPDTDVADVLLGSVALVGALLLASLTLGGVVGAALVYVKHRLGYGGPDAEAKAHVVLAIGRDEPPVDPQA